MLLLSVTIALYGSTLYYGLVWDDFLYIRGNYRIQVLSADRLRDIWTSTFLGNYAPLHNTLLALLYSLSGLEPFAYHLTQFLLQCACVCMLYFVLKEAESGPVALLASLLFAVYPPNIETVAWVSETKSTLAFLFFLISLHYFIRLREQPRWTNGVLSGLFLVLSLLSKINTVVAPLVFILYDYRKERPIVKTKQTWTTVCFLLIGLLFAAIHLASSSGLSRTAPEFLVDATLPHASLTQPAELRDYYGGIHVHLLNLSRFILYYVRMIFYPHPLTHWQMFLVYGKLTWPIGLAWTTLLGLGWLLYRSPRNIQFWGLWFLIFLLPVLQFVPNPIWVANRYLYVPAIGAFVLGSRLFFFVSEKTTSRSAHVAWETLMAAILVVFAWQTYRHVPAWRNDLTLWQDAAKRCDPSAFCHYRLGQALLADGQANSAVKEFSRAVQIRPTARYLIQLGDAYSDRLGSYEQAMRAYRAVQDLGPVLPLSVLISTAKSHYLAGEYDQARGLVDTGLKLSPDNANLLILNGFLEWKQGRMQPARDSIRRALAINAANPLSAHPARFLNFAWEHPAQVGQLLAALGPL
ncbi:MAG: glycosyltransferase family 39 protein [Acidobacteria bacterium]|nr:glycosyltransferase family 39 protein [Acidobacteriota bacterium]